MKSAVATLKLLAAIPFLIVCAAASAAADVPEPKVERVVMLMRHGIRPPTKTQPIPSEYSPLAWPKWTVEPGHLTERGEKGVSLLASADRARFIDEGLLPASGCPASGTVKVRASNKARAIDTAKVWASAIFPGCALPVDNPGVDGPDPLFHGLGGGPTAFDLNRAYKEVTTKLPNGNFAAEMRRLQPELRLLEEILACKAPACDLEKPPTRLIEKAGRPGLEGPLDVAATASQSLLLEYVEGMPMSDVGWGRASRDDIERLLVFHPTKFKYANRTSYIAQAAAGELARTILEALAGRNGAVVTLLAGHDTNLADLGGLLQIHWQAASYPADDVPPGGALGFELVSKNGAGKFVRAFFRSQTMDQLRNLTPLEGPNAPYFAYLDIPGCGTAAEPFGCDLPTFAQLVLQKNAATH